MRSYENISPEEWIASTRKKVAEARERTALQVNSELLQFYFEIGASILEVQKKQGWGSGIIDQLAGEIKTAFPSSGGFSVRNLKYMRAFAQAYPDFPIVQVPLAQIPWYHHISLLTKVKDLDERLFYMVESAKNGWSRDTMLLQVKSDLNRRQGGAISNFKQTCRINNRILYSKP